MEADAEDAARLELVHLQGAAGTYRCAVLVGAIMVHASNDRQLRREERVIVGGTTLDEAPSFQPCEFRATANNAPGARLECLLLGRERTFPGTSPQATEHMRAHCAGEQRWIY